MLVLRQISFSRCFPHSVCADEQILGTLIRKNLFDGVLERQYVASFFLDK